MSERIARLNPADSVWQVQDIKCRIVLAELPSKQPTQGDLVALKALLLTGLSRLEQLDGGARNSGGVQFNIAVSRGCSALYVKDLKTSIWTEKQTTNSARVCFNEAVKTARWLYEKLPEHIESARLLKRYLIGSAEKDPLLSFYQGRLKEEPDNPSWLEGYAQCLCEGAPPAQRAFNARESKRLYDQLLRSNPDNTLWLSGGAKALEEIVADPSQKGTKDLLDHLAELVSLSRKLRDLDSASATRVRLGARPQDAGPGSP